MLPAFFACEAAPSVDPARRGNSTHRSKALWIPGAQRLCGGRKHIDRQLIVLVVMAVRLVSTWTNPALKQLTAGRCFVGKSVLGCE